MLLTGTFYLLPFLFAFIGWLVAKAATSIYMSIILKKKQSLGTTIGNYVAAQFSFDDVEQTLTTPDSINKILPFADEHIENFLRVKLPAAMPMLAMFISDKLVLEMKSIFMKELQELFPALIKQYLTGIKTNLDVSQFISGKINSVSNNTIKAMLKKPLLIVDFASATTGFVCGCFYILLTLLA